MDIRREGTTIATNVAGSGYTDHINERGSGSYTYEVCDTGSTTTCSNAATVTF